MTDFTQRDSGLVVPKEKPPLPSQPLRGWGALEIQNESDRKMFRKAFTEMLNSACCQVSGIEIEPSGKRTCKIRQDLIAHIASMLLGDDFTWEELC